MSMTTPDFETDSGGTFLLLGLTAIFGLICFLMQRRPKNFPPGPTGLPILGYAPFLGKNMAETLRKMKSKYGPVMSIKMGGDDWVILNDYEHINQALVMQGDKFSGRPSNFMYELLTQGASFVLLDYGPEWKKLRKFGLVNLRGFGVGKKSMEENIEEELAFLVQNLMKTDGETVSAKLTSGVSNIICRIVFGSRFSYDDERFQELTKLVRNFFSEGRDVKMFGILSLAPALRHIPPFRGAMERLHDNHKRLFSIIGDIVQEHRDTYDENDTRDIIDAFLKEMEKNNGLDSSFSEKRLLLFVHDLFEAGTETTSSTLTWAMLSFLTYPDCQEKIAEEVQQVIGESVTPSMKHRDKMPYTCAFIQELMRHRTIAPMSVIHKTSAAAKLGGYTIPKNCTISPNLWAVHMDPNTFKNPSKFRPERFLNEKGEFIESGHVIPFSIGPRHCLGKQLAKMEVFIFLTGIVQKLRVLPDPASPPPPFETTEIKNSLSLNAPKFTAIFKRR